MSSYFKTGTEVGKSNGFLKGLMKCRSQMAMLHWFERHPKQIVKDDVQYYKDKIDLTLPENAAMAKMIQKLQDMMA